MAVEVFGNIPTTTVTAGGTTAPAAGTQETWTVASSTGFPAASSSATPPTQFHVADVALNSEMISVINVSGTTWTVIRGDEGTTPVAHGAGFTIYQVASAGAYTQLRSLSWLNVVTMFGADPTGSADSTTAIQKALNSVPAAGGVVYLPAGTYKVSSTVTNAVTPTYIAGDGRWATTVTFTGTGDCIRMYNPHYGGGGLWGGGVRDLTIDGTSAGNGSAGLHIGDGEQYELNVAVWNFSGTGSIGVHLDNTIWWTEKCHGTIYARNCTQHVVFDVTSTGTTIASGSNGGIIANIASWSSPSAGVLDVASTAGYPSSGTVDVSASGPTTAIVTYTGTSGGNQLTGCAYVSGSPSGTVATGGSVSNPSSTATNSYGYLDLTCYVYVQPDQDGVAVLNGAYLYHGHLAVKGNFQGSASAVTDAVLRLTGTMPGAAASGSGIEGCHLDIQAEVGVYANQPRTLFFGTSGVNFIRGCYGVMDFTQGAGTFANVNLTVADSASVMSFNGLIIGDSLINPGGNFPVPVTIGTQVLSKSFMSGSAGNVFIVWGDFFAATLSASITISLNPTVNGFTQGVIPAPQRKTIIITQAASGGPYTVTWPQPGSPSISTPAVYWAGGTAPVMSPAASAVDVYNLVTIDGIHWYGTVIQVSPPPASGQYLCAPHIYAPGTRTTLTVNSTTLAAWSTGNVCTNSFTAPASGAVVVTFNGIAEISIAGDLVGLALAATGTVTPVIGNVYTAAINGTSVNQQMTAVFYVTGLTAGNSYQLDLLGCTTSGATASMQCQGQTSTSLVAAGAPATMIVQAV